jgi:hypothetical protein
LKKWILISSKEYYHGNGGIYASGHQMDCMVQKEGQDENFMMPSSTQQE